MLPSLFSVSVPVFQQRRVALDTGLTLSFLEWGADRPDREHTVLLIHGFLDLSWTWVGVVPHGLAARYHVVAPDMRGHGDSDRVGAGGYYHFMDYVADLASLVDRVGRERVSLVGHSMGGSVSAYHAGAFPERVSKLALLEGLGPPEDETPPPRRVAIWSRAWRRVRETEPRVHASIEAAAERLRAADPLLDPALAMVLADKGTRPHPSGGRVFKHDPLHVTHGPYPFRLDVARTFWRSIACPVLLVEGAESPFRALADLEERVACLKSPERVVLPGAGHMLQRHQPEALARALLQFLD